MKLICYGLLLQFFLMSTLISGRSETILIFQGMQGQPLGNAAGMNVAHQVLTGLIQKAAPMLVSLDVWNHILQRRDRCKKALLEKESLHSKVDILVQELKSLIFSGKSLDDINLQLNTAWYQQKYPTLAVLDADKNKEVMFDYFCMHVDELVSVWKSYRLQEGYILFLPVGVDRFFNLEDLPTLSRQQLLTVYATVQFISLASVLRGLLQTRKISWNFYVTGHGHHADESNSESIIAGMTIPEFQQFLMLLNNSFKTGILVYSSCYSSGIHLIDPYQVKKTVLPEPDGNGELKLNYPVVATCLTDAPVYVFGMPSGLKLPPYDQSFRLEKADVDHKKLNWYLLQNFPNFVRAVARKKSLKDIAQSVMMYQECHSHVCNLAKLENIPVVRKPGTTFFVPIDTTFVDFIIHNQTETKIVDGKHGLLWYIKQYDGTVSFKDRLAQCISMVPGDGVIWMHKLQANGFSLNEIVQQLFFSVDDLYGVQIYLCDQLVCRDNNTHEITLQRFMVLPKSNWLPQGLAAGDGGLCCYLQGQDGYSASITKSGQIGQPSKLNNSQLETIHKLWSLLYQESGVQRGISADKLWLQDNLQYRKKAYEQILQSCQLQLVCS